MTAHDWLAVLILTGILVASLCVDAVRRTERRRLDRSVHGDRHRQLMAELRRQPYHNGWGDQ
jgi:hypothetical protein